jgi:hypothetical protein
MRHSIRTVPYDLLCELAAKTHKYKLFTVGACVDAVHFRSMSPCFRQEADEDPHYLGFLKLIRMALERSKGFIPQEGEGPVDISLVIDDSEKYSMACYKILNKIKTAHAEIRPKIVGICFAKDEHMPAMQLADMLAHQARANLITRKQDPTVGPSRLYTNLTKTAGEPYLLDGLELDGICSRWKAGEGI